MLPFHLYLKNLSAPCGAVDLPANLVDALPKLIPEAGGQEQIEMLEQNLAENYLQLKLIKAQEKASAAEPKQPTLAITGLKETDASIRYLQMSVSNFDTT